MTGTDGLGIEGTVCGVSTQVHRKRNDKKYKENGEEETTSRPNNQVSKTGR